MRKESLQQLKRLLPDGAFLDSPEALVGYSYDSQAVGSLPEAVVLPTSTEEVVTVLAFCNTNGIPVTARGAGSGTTGGSENMKVGIYVCHTVELLAWAMGFAAGPAEKRLQASHPVKTFENVTLE